ncbi:RNA polymerase subunit sigma-24 [Bifidobacterium primatium]|uniref:RNA polymerase subunit sigma-24 n=1 Tax=Bifidobacterium primatium TaxID=2045438 RepID=A0A2M9H8P2_9BIFI|nr:RNA polymerase sigma factor [Bifidobacterium primatium]PJM73169.1 RNA polymerase subunit sigma-24 [Bifidobacterium primatium]
MTLPGGEMTRDEDLLARVASGDERAFETLYGRYAVAVRAFVRARVSDTGMAEEVCADVWLGCWRSAKAFRGDAKVLSWLLGIAKRQIYMRVRRGRPNVTALDDAPEPRDDGPSPETAVLSEAGVDDLTALLRRLPVELVETATLAWLHGLPYRQIARLLDVPEGTVKSRVSRARRLLRAQLGHENDADGKER